MHVYIRAPRGFVGLCEFHPVVCLAVYVPLVLIIGHHRPVTDNARLHEVFRLFKHKLPAIIVKHEDFPGAVYHLRQSRKDDI